jgi:glycosyltransferase involved in cell wall biosynthesis
MPGFSEGHTKLNRVNGDRDYQQVQGNDMVLVSVIIPMRNAERYITATLESILQEHAIPLEVIVVDDGSTDASQDRIKAIHDPRVRLVSSFHQGIANAMNLGLAEARGEIVMRCDADDLYLSSRLSFQTQWLLQHPDFDAVCGGYSTVDARGRLVAHLNCGAEPEDITDELRRGITRTHLCTFAIRAQAIRAIGGFRSYFRTAEDIDLQLRLADRSNIWYEPALFYCYRLHAHSIIHTQSSVEREFFEATAREFAHQRQQGRLDELQQGIPPQLPQGNSHRRTTSREHIQGLLLYRAWKEHELGQRWQAFRTGLRSVVVRPTEISAWRNVLALAIKPSPGLKANENVSTPLMM